MGAVEPSDCIPVTVEACARGISSVEQTSGEDGARGAVIRVNAIALSSPPEAIMSSVEESGRRMRHLMLLWWIRWRVFHWTCVSVLLMEECDLQRKSSMPVKPASDRAFVIGQKAMCPSVPADRRKDSVPR